MAKSFHNNVFDNGLNHVKNNATKMVLCKQPPVSFTDANNLDTDGTPGYKVAEAVIAPADMVVGDKTGGGREITVAAKNSIVALDDSLVSDDLHVALLDLTNSLVLAVTDETTDQVITNGNNINFPSFKFGFGDPV